MARRWRVQATWTVDGEPHSYAPIFVRTRFQAARQKKSIEETLWHFPTLDVKVERVTSAEAEEELRRRSKS